MEQIIWGMVNGYQMFKVSVKYEQQQYTAENDYGNEEVYVYYVHIAVVGRTNFNKIHSWITEGFNQFNGYISVY
jgi:hypothetical protein